jgi:succinoglycan biosynthesis transport protein ExoP
VLWSRAPFIVGLVVLAAVLAYALSSIRTDLYRATSTIRVVDPNTEAIFDNGNLRVDPKRDLDTQLRLLQSADLRDAVEAKLGDGAEGIAGVSVSAVGSTDLISIAVSSPEPAIARDAANAYADLYVAERKERVSGEFIARADELRGKAAELDRQIAELDRQLGEDFLDPSQADVLRSQRTSLVTQQAELRIRATEFDVEAATRTGNAEIAETASVPTAPFSPTPRRDAALAGVLALLIGVGLAFLLDRLDDKIKGADDVERVTGGVPVLGAIPIHAEGKKGATRLPRGGDRLLVPLKSTTAEAYRTLRTSLRFSSIGTTRKTIVITSSDQAEGKSTVAANLAVVLAESGLRVVLISADLRKPTLASIFGISDADKGLTTVLVGDATLNECLRPVTTASGQHLYLLPSGPVPQNPAELLGSKGMRDIVATIESAGVDYLLIDSPPVLPVSDAMAVAQFADGVLVLSVANQTRLGHLGETVDRLRQVNADVIGVVVNGVPTRGRYYGAYYGRYGYGAYGSSYTTEVDSKSRESSRAAKAPAGQGTTVGDLPHMFGDADAKQSVDINGRTSAADSAKAGSQSAE